ncbi:hypothetical protein BC829DRAFT_464455 [Chytridium lagenaria]|nr:hypothetical protein BC829DRAFT_464455 [Chytridium lagenaria]
MPGMAMPFPPPPPPTFIPVASEPVSGPFTLSGKSRKKARTIVIPPVSAVQAVKARPSNQGTIKKQKRPPSPDPVPSQKRIKAPGVPIVITDISDSSDKELLDTETTEATDDDGDQSVDLDKPLDPEKSDEEDKSEVDEEDTVINVNDESITALSSFSCPARNAETEKLLQPPKDKEKLSAALKPLKITSDLALESFKLEAAQRSQISTLVAAANSGMLQRRDSQASYAILRTFPAFNSSRQTLCRTNSHWFRLRGCILGWELSSSGCYTRLVKPDFYAGEFDKTLFPAVYFGPAPTTAPVAVGAGIFGKGPPDLHPATAGAVIVEDAFPIHEEGETVKVTAPSTRNRQSPRIANNDSTVISTTLRHAKADAGRRLSCLGGRRNPRHVGGSPPPIFSSSQLVEDLDGYLEDMGQSDEGGRWLDLITVPAIQHLTVYNGMVEDRPGVLAVRDDHQDIRDTGPGPPFLLARTSFFSSPSSNAGTGEDHSPREDIRIRVEGLLPGYHINSPATSTGSSTAVSPTRMADPTYFCDRTKGQVAPDWRFSSTQSADDAIPFQDEHLTDNPVLHGGPSVPFWPGRCRRLPSRSPTPTRMESVSSARSGTCMESAGDAIWLPQRTPHIYHADETTPEDTSFQRFSHGGLYRRHRICRDHPTRHISGDIDGNPLASDTRMALEVVKSRNPPLPRRTFVGLDWDLKQALILLPPSRLKGLRATLLAASRRASLPLRQTARVLGVANAAAIAIPALNAYLRPLQRRSQHSIGFGNAISGSDRITSDVDALLRLAFRSPSPETSRNDDIPAGLEWNQHPTSSRRFEDFRGCDPQLRMGGSCLGSLDATPSSSRRALEPQITSALLSGSSDTLHSIGDPVRTLGKLISNNVLEAIAQDRSVVLLQRLGVNFTKKHVLHMSDNTPTVWYINRAGGTRSLRLSLVAERLFCRYQALQSTSTLGASFGGPVLVRHKFSAPSLLHIGSEGSVLIDGQRDVPPVGTGERVDQPTLDIDSRDPHEVDCRQSDSHAPDASLAHPIVVASLTAHDDRHPLSTPITPDELGGGGIRSCTSSERIDRYLADMWRIQGFTDVPQETKNLMARRWSSDTIKADARNWDSYLSWCRRRGVHPDTSTVSDWLTFFTHLFEEGRTGDYISKHRATLAKVFPSSRPAFTSIAEYPEFKHIIGGIIRERPHAPKGHFEAFDPELLYLYVVTALSPNHHSSLDPTVCNEDVDVSYENHLCVKFNILMHLLDKQRTSDVTNVLADGLRVLPDAICYQLYRGKGWRPGHPDCRIRYVPRILDPPGLDVGTLVDRIIVRTAQWRDPQSIKFLDTGPNLHSFLLLHPKTHQGTINANTLARQTKEHMRRAGIPEPFTTHSITHAVATAQTIVGIPEGHVNSGRWRSVPVMRAHYIAKARHLWRPADFVPLHFVTARPFGWQGDQPPPDVS